jgi:hypothetical protein
MRTSEFAARQSKKVVWGLTNIQLVSEIRTALRRSVPLTYEVWPNSG